MSSESPMSSKSPVSSESPTIPTTPIPPIPWKTLELYSEAFQGPKQSLTDASLFEIKECMHKIAHEARYSNIFDPINKDLFTDLLRTGRITSNELEILLATFEEQAFMREQARFVLSLLEEEEKKSDNDPGDLRETADELHQIWSAQILHAEWLVIFTIWCAFLEPDVIPQLIADARRFPITPIVFPRSPTPTPQ